MEDDAKVAKESMHGSKAATTLLTDPQAKPEEGITRAEMNQEVSVPISEGKLPRVWKDRSFCEGLLIYQL